MTIFNHFKSIGVQRYLPFEKGLIYTVENKCDIFYIEGSLPTDAATEWDSNRIKNALLELEKYQKKTIFHGNFKNPICHEIPAIREAAYSHILLELNIAAELGAPLIVHGSSFFTHRDVPQIRKDSIMRYSEAISKLSDIAKIKGTEIWVENLEYYKNKAPFYNLVCLEEDYDIIFDYAPEAKFIIDVGHQHISENNEVSIFRKFIDKIRAIDFNDNDGQIDKHLHLGSGTLKTKELMKAIKELNWQGIAIFETVDSTPSNEIQTLESIYKTI